MQNIRSNYGIRNILAPLYQVNARNHKRERKSVKEALKTMKIEFSPELTYFVPVFKYCYSDNRSL